MPPKAVPEDEPNLLWHTLGIREIRDRLETGDDGLPALEAARRSEEYGKNSLPERKPPSRIRIFFRQFASPLIYVLIAAGVLSIAFEDWTDAIFIFAVIFLNSGIGSIQEWKAEKSAAALVQMLRIYARVRRDGHEEKISAEDLVPGDIVILESGSRVPADLRIISASSLAIDESLLTGESEPTKKRTVTLPEGTAVADRHNMAYAGTTVVSGRGTGIVTGTGLRTEIGKIAASVSSSAMGKPPLLIRMEAFAQKISIAVLFASALIAVIVLSQGEPPREVFFLAIALAVAAIPEGLPVALTVALAIATGRMAERHVIVRQLSAVESLGSCTVIASDKTGTLTVNQQTAQVVILPDGTEYTVSGEGYTGEGEITLSGDTSVSSEEPIFTLTKAAIIANEGDLRERNGEGWLSHGDAMDIALLALGYKAGIDPAVIRDEIAVLAEIPFSSENRFTSVWYQEGDERRVAVKGALEVILPGCRTMLTGEGSLPVDAEAIERQIDSLTGRGYRVLAIAGGLSDPEEVKGGPPPLLELYGLVGFIDPIRHDVYESVRECREAGVDVVMITGDHPKTALAIARQLAIADDEGDLITGSDLAAVGAPDSPAFLSMVQDRHVFARVSPDQKLHIVNALKASGEFVAVTGDGVNDAPALRSANIGVAMGSGTDVAKDTASMIITDDSFSSIVAGIEEGRYAYDNVRKVTYLLVSTGFAEVALFIAALAIGLPLPLIAVQLLWLNLVTNGIKGVTLAFEPGEAGAMQRPPRSPDEPVFNDVMMRQIVVAGLTMGGIALASWYWLLGTGYSESEARNLIVLLMVMLENFHVLNCRSEYRSFFKIPIQTNLYLFGGIVAAQVIHTGAMYIPFFQDVLGIAPVSATEWVMVIILSSSVLLVMEIYKFIINRRGTAEGDLLVTS
ncbi:ATPase [Methanocalculus chunghsingensis]|uniref:ATPase n=2 Tax=Methanocalculus chunghsingensis TaxID=156457 RepID=A0A8J8B3T7_9EURY|nr:ATPase [Methanocalculus chunghsingensis]